MSFKKKPVGFGKKPNLHALGLQNIRSARRRWASPPSKSVYSRRLLRSSNCRFPWVT